MRQISDPRTKRFSWDEVFMNLAILVSNRTACRFHEVGVVLVDDNKRIISLGYNGPVSGDYNCIEAGCAKIDGDLKTKKIERCRGVHAEINGIINCQDTRRLRGAVLYATTLPCYDCMKALANSGVAEIVYLETYQRIKDGGKGMETEDEVWDLAKKLGVKLRKYKGEIDINARK